VPAAEAVNAVLLLSFFMLQSELLKLFEPAQEQHDQKSALHLTRQKGVQTSGSE
jgi:hypothetical protein